MIKNVGSDNKRDEFIRKAKEVHKGENIDYSKVVYINNRTPVILIDNDLDKNGEPYGEYIQTPYNHLRGQSHPKKKGSKISNSKRAATESIIERFKNMHKGENLDYSKVEYVNMHTKVLIISHDLDKDGNEYGEFWQDPVVHLKGCSHPRMAIDRNADACRYTTDIFVKKCIELYGTEHYDFSHVNYVNSKTKVNVFCNRTYANGEKHGFFEVSPDIFLQGKGCPVCGRQSSDNEKEILGFISDIVGKENVISNDTRILEGYELDIYVPSHKLAIEYNGLYWHTTEFKPDKNYHVNKTNKCLEQGIRLIHVFEDEYLEHKQLIFNKLRHILGKDGNMAVIGARKCHIEAIDKSTAKAFLDKYHIQGFAPSTVYMGAFHNGEIVAVMSFKRQSIQSDKWELNRFATRTEYRLPGVASKILKRFIIDYNPTEIKSFLDRCWNQEGDNIYEKTGFRLDKVLAPDYTYVVNNKRRHKFTCRKGILSKKFGFPMSMTEKEMTEKLGYGKIYDCGLVRYIWQKK